MMNPTKSTAGAAKLDRVIEGVVEVVEPLGAEQHVVVSVGDASITARRPREERVNRDQKVTELAATQFLAVGA